MPMTDETKKEVEGKMTPQLAAHAEYLLELAKVQADGLAKTLNDLADTMEKCGYPAENSAPVRRFTKQLTDLSASMLGGAK